MATCWHSLKVRSIRLRVCETCSILFSIHSFSILVLLYPLPRHSGFNSSYRHQAYKSFCAGPQRYPLLSFPKAQPTPTHFNNHAALHRLFRCPWLCLCGHGSSIQPFPTNLFWRFFFCERCSCDATAQPAQLELWV
ncbi:hypothetical protein V8C37DRAFT_364680 [Trichoderma ceciliae]